MDEIGADTSVVIRSYRPGDIESCRALWVELTDWHRQIYESPNIGGSDPGRHFDDHLGRVGAENLWVAEIGGQVVGLAGMIPDEREAELEPLVVSKQYRGRGIGRRLGEATIAAAQARGVSELKVRPVARNTTAIQFFHRQGFNILGHIELFMDFKPAESQEWISGERIAGREFRV